MLGKLHVPQQAPSGPIQIPMVYVKGKSVWEYKQLIRNLRTEQAPSQDELNTLGADGWELAGVFADLPFVYFYFKRLVE